MVMKQRSRKPELFPRWEEGLNPEQLEAMRHDEGPCRVLALAGSGKTTVVTRRIARLVAQGVEPGRILAVTFTKKAAGEMTARVRKLGAHEARVGTWHSFAYQILRDDRTRWADWEVERGGESKRALKEVLGYKGMNWLGSDATAVAAYIGRCKANLYKPGTTDALDAARREFGANALRADEAHLRFNDELAAREVLTYDDMLVFANDHLALEENRARWAARFDHVMQDEAQDESRAQKRLAELLAQDHRNYMAIGDANQAIFSWRGSSPEFIAAFEEEWPGARTVVLPRNYRSGRAIVAAANGILANAARFDGIATSLEMVGERDAPGSVEVRPTEDLDDEGANFAAWVKEKVAGGARYSEVMCLYRVNAQSRAVEEALLRERVPYVVVKGVSFYERREVRDLLAYLRVAAERGEGSHPDVKRCINAPFRYLGARFVERLMDAAEGGAAVGWTELVRRVAAQDGIQRRQRDGAEEWAAIVEGARDVARAGGEAGWPAEILDGIVRRTRYLEWLTKDEGEESVENSGGANVREMVRVARNFATVGELLDYVDETIESSKRQRESGAAGGERVTLMTVHASKGLEAPHVWVLGCNDSVLPHGRGDPAEERRIAYVAATRARDSLVLSHVRTMATSAGIRDAHPSPYLAEVEAALAALTRVNAAPGAV